MYTIYLENYCCQLLILRLRKTILKNMQYAWYDT